MFPFMLNNIKHKKYQKGNKWYEHSEDIKLKETQQEHILTK